MSEEDEDEDEEFELHGFHKAAVFVLGALATMMVEQFVEDAYSKILKKRRPKKAKT